MTTPSEPLRERFLASARATVDRLRQYAALLQADPRDVTLLDTMRRELHRLRGSAGSYGFDTVTERLGQMEQRTSQWAIDPTLDAEDRAAHVLRLADSLQTVFAVAGDAAREGKVVDVWCVDPPPDRIVAWSAHNPTTGLRFVIMGAVEFAERIRRRERPFAVLAPVDVGHALRVPDGLPLVLLADARHVVGAASRSFGAVTTVDRNIAMDDLLVTIERLARRTSVVGGSVVVLDDDPMILLLAKAICDDAGLRAVTISDPALLMRTLTDERPGVLLMDVQLPGTTGFELTRALRADVEWAELPIVLFSADSSQEARERGVQAGASAFLSKPLAPSELRTQLLARLEQVRQLRLARGLSPSTGLPEHEVGLRAAEQLFGVLRREGGSLGAAVARLRKDEDDTRWPMICAEIAKALRPTGAAIAHYDATALVATLRGGYDPLLRALEQLQAEDLHEVEWVAGYAEASTVGAAHPDDLWHAAADAADAAIVSGVPSRAWNQADSTRAPDVLIVEDDRAFSDLLEYALHQEGYSFRTLRTGPEALEALRSLKVGALKPLILLDLDLPGLDGHAIHERIRLERPRDYIVVFLSVHAGDADQVRALRAGAADYLTKPVSMRVLMSKLPRWVRQSRKDR